MKKSREFNSLKEATKKLLEISKFIANDDSIHRVEGMLLVKVEEGYEASDVGNGFKFFSFSVFSDSFSLLNSYVEYQDYINKDDIKWDDDSGEMIFDFDKIDFDGLFNDLTELIKKRRKVKKGLIFE